jgi:hypothetical protein
MDIKYQTIFNNLFSDLNPKRKEILERRFGIKSQEGETLQSIGEDMGITRERVRQLINDSLNLIREQKARELALPLNYLEEYFHDNGGLKREERIYQEIAPDKFKGYVSFLLTISPEFDRFNEDQNYYSFWSEGEDPVIYARKTIDSALRKLEKINEPTPLDELIDLTGEDLDEKVFVSYIEISKQISSSPEGRFGLMSWPEINPKGVRDRAYIVLKHEGKPIHFTEITKRINGLNYDKKKVLAESVHNELIRSQLFVLVGRGLYALKEWGYEPGTVKDVIIKILQESNKPMTKQEIAQEVLRRRQVKANTIILNLQDKNIFSRAGDGKIWLK